MNRKLRTNRKGIMSVTSLCSSLVRPSLMSLPIIAFLMMFNCTDLEESYEGNLTEVDETQVGALFITMNNSLKLAFQSPWEGVFPLTEVTTDDMIVPTRGPNWEDNGLWRQLHQHRWTGGHGLVLACFNKLNGIVFTTTDLLRYDLKEREAEVRFYRAWAMYWVLDLFDKVPYREPKESTLLPARVRVGIEALEYIISELNAIMPKLGNGPAGEVTVNAARVFLMKCYLNRAVYLNREHPEFRKEDMNMVISLADEVINSNQYTFSDNYFDNFAPTNTDIGKENIFTLVNIGGVTTDMGYDGIVGITFAPRHYNANPGGVNGFAVLSDLYDAFEPQDKRKGQVYPTQDGPPNPGNRIDMGLLVGQQYDLWTDQPLSYGAGEPLSYTREVEIIESGPNLEVAGIRPIKYAIDYHEWWIGWDNDWVLFRLPDVLLMKAEAVLRGGQLTASGPYGSSVADLVNAIRTHPSRGASKLTSVDLNIILEERYREFWLECWRRQDMIRFGTFLEPFQEKSEVSNSRYLIFPIPDQQVALNKNLSQNSGY